MSCSPADPPVPPDFDKLWDFSNPAATETAFRALIPELEAAGNTDHLLQLHTQIARTQGLQRQFDEAHATLDAVEARLTDDVPVARVRYLLERGRVRNSGGEETRGRQEFLTAWDEAREIDADFHAVDAAHMLEIVSTGEEKLKWNAAACDVARASDDPRARKWMGSLLNNRGWTLHETERYAEALVAFEECETFMRENDFPEGRVDIARYSVAKTQRLMGEPEPALAVMLELVEKTPDDGYFHEELGECYLALGRPGEATAPFARAHALLSADDWVKANEPEHLERLAKLGKVGQTD